MDNIVSWAALVVVLMRRSMITVTLTNAVVSQLVFTKFRTQFPIYILRKTTVDRTDIVYKCDYCLIIYDDDDDYIFLFPTPFTWL